MERRYLSDCIIEQAKEDSSNLIPFPKPKESSLFYTNTKLVTRIRVRELTSFSSTDKQRTVTRKDNDDNLSDEGNKINEDIDTATIDKTSRNDIRSRGLRLALSYIHSNDNQISILNGSDENIPDYSRANSFQMPQQFLRKRGWARRPKQGQMYGKKYMDESYKSLCKSLFELGEQDSNKKKGPTQMHEILLLRNPHKYSIPNESEMRTLIGSLMKAKKKQEEEKEEEDGDDDNNSDRENNDQFPKEYEEFIKGEIEIAFENDEMDQLLPTLLLKAAKDKFKSNRQLRITHAETEKKFKKRVSALKSSYKKKQETTRRNKAADG